VLLHLKLWFQACLRTAYHPILIADWHGLHCAAAKARACGQSGHWSGNEATEDHVGQKRRTASSKTKGTEHRSLNVHDCNIPLCSSSQLLDYSDCKHDVRSPLQVAEIADGVQKILQSIASGNTEVSIVTASKLPAIRNACPTLLQCVSHCLQGCLPSNAPLLAPQMVKAAEASGGLAQM